MKEIPGLENAIDTWGLQNQHLESTTRSKIFAHMMWFKALRGGRTSSRNGVSGTWSSRESQFFSRWWAEFQQISRDHSNLINPEICCNIFDFERSLSFRGGFSKQKPVEIPVFVYWPEAWALPKAGPFLRADVLFHVCVGPKIFWSMHLWEEWMERIRNARWLLKFFVWKKESHRCLIEAQTRGAETFDGILGAKLSIFPHRLQAYSVVVSRVNGWCGRLRSFSYS